MDPAHDAHHGEATRLLQAFGHEADAAERLLPLVYDELRAIAQNRMNDERAGHTLEATALVHEAYLRLVGGEARSWEGRRHFFGVAADAMRKILIDHARRRNAVKRGRGRPALPGDVLDLIAGPSLTDALALDEALDALELEDPRAAMVVKYRFFAGLDTDDIAELLDLSRRTVLREWQFARARLGQIMEA